MSSFLESTMELLRDLTLTCMSLQILVKAVHIKGNLNTESDLISRGRINDFLTANPESRDQRIDIPTKLWPTSWRPSMQQRSSGQTEFRKARRWHSNYSKRHVKSRNSHWN